MVVSQIKPASKKASRGLAGFFEGRRRKRSQFTHEVQRRIVKPRGSRRVVVKGKISKSEPRHAAPEPQQNSVIEAWKCSDAKLWSAIAAGVAAAALIQRFGSSRGFGRTLSPADFAIMLLSMRKTTALIREHDVAEQVVDLRSKAATDATTQPQSVQARNATRPGSGTPAGLHGKLRTDLQIAIAGLIHGAAFAAVPNAARWMGAGLGAAALNDAIDGVFEIADKRSGPVEIIERRVSVSPVKRFS